MTEAEYAEKFWARVRTPAPWGDECWEWEGPIDRGYGRTLTPAGTLDYAHRVAYRLSGGQLPKGTILHHRCGNRLCQRPGHLVPTTRREHALHDSRMKAFRLRLRTACIRGHRYTPQTTRYHSKTGARMCRVCETERRRSGRAAR